MLPLTVTEEGATVALIGTLVWLPELLKVAKSPGVNAAGLPLFKVSFQVRFAPLLSQALAPLPDQTKLCTLPTIFNSTVPLEALKLAVCIPTNAPGASLNSVAGLPVTLPV